MNPSRLPCALAMGFMGLALAACGRAETAADKHFAELNDQVTTIQADQDERSKAGKIDGDEKTPPPMSPPASAKSAPPAAPRVVQLGGDDSNENDDPNAPTERPEIRVQGTAGGSGMTRPAPNRRVRSGDDGLSGTTVTQAGGGDRSSANDPEARRAYDQAIQLVQSKQNDKALDALNAFLVKWPDHPNAELAMYWRGEIFYAQGEYLRAAEQFEAVVARFGGGRKAPDALLKIGMCHDKLGAPSRANEYWARLKRDFPQSDAARKIPKETR